MRIDRRRCQRCGAHFPYGDGLTVHHIRPRAEGGDESMGNLISLCSSCHDWVEGRGLRSRAAIVGSLAADDLPTVDHGPRPAAARATFYHAPGRHTFWINGAWHGVGQGAAVVEIWRYRRLGTMTLQDRLDLETGEGYWGRRCDDDTNTYSRNVTEPGGDA